MIVYKLTDQAMRTHGGFQYTLDEWADATGSSNDLCSNGVLHAYETPYHAVLFNPLHADIKAPRLFECEASELLGNDGLKTWHKRLRLIREVPLPEVTIEKRTEFAIRCAARVSQNDAWISWADAWLNKTDRSEQAARAAARAAHAYAAAYADAAYAAARAAYAADAADAAADAAYAAYAAARAAKNIIPTALKDSGIIPP